MFSPFRKLPLSTISSCYGLGFVALLLGSAGCSVTALAERESSIAVNECEAAEDCPGVACVDGMCVSGAGSFASLLFEVSPAVSASTDRYPGEQLFRLAEGLPTGGGSFQLVFGDLADVTARVRTALGSDCPSVFVDPNTDRSLALASDGSVPGRVTFTPTERAWGLSTSSRTVLVEAADVQASPVSYPLTVSLPAGSFDIYVEPYAVGSAVASGGTNEGMGNAKSCTLPPQLLRDQKFTATKTDLNIALPAPAHLDVEIEFPASAGTLDGWTIEMLEVLTGRVVSTKARLALPKSLGGVFSYSVGLDYFPVPGDDERVSSGELLRLSPPAGLVAPVLFFQREALELFTKGTARINQLAEFPKPVTLDAQVIDALTNAPVPASVTLIATKLGKIPDGTLASFIRSSEAGDDGVFSAAVLPGTYKVHVVPSRSSASGVPLAAMEAIWQVAAEPPTQRGRTIALHPAAAIRGRALLRPSDEGARGAMVAAEPAARRPETSVLARAIDALPLVPRTLRTTVRNASGDFALYADPGTFDFSIRPPEGSGFAWLVMPELEVDASAGGIDLRELRMEPPVVLQINATIGDQPTSAALLAGAYLRAYALLDADGLLTHDAQLARAAVPVAETRLDAEGRAAVLLPARLNDVPSP